MKKKLIFIITLVSSLALGLFLWNFNVQAGEVSQSYSWNLNVSNEKLNKEVNFRDNIEVIVQNNKIQPSYLVNPNGEGTRALVMNPFGEGFSIIDSGGNIIDELEDLKDQMTLLKTESNDDYHFLHAAHFYNDDKIIFLSNYDSINSNGSLWEMDLNTREMNKVLNAQQYGDISIVHVGLETILVFSNFNNTMLQIQGGEIIEHDIRGHILSVSPDGNYVAYQVKKDEDALDNKIGFYEISTKSNQIVGQIGNDRFYNSGGVWDKSSSMFAFFTPYYDGHNSNEHYTKIDLIIFNVKSGNVQIETKAPDGHIFSIEPGSLAFINSELLEVELLDKKAQLKLQ